MLKKLFKYDIHFQIKRVLPLYLITLAMALALRCMQFLTQKLVFLQFILGFMVIGFIILLVALFLWTFIVSVKYFYDTMLKDEAYLGIRFLFHVHKFSFHRICSSLHTWTCGTCMFAKCWSCVFHD